MPVVHAHNVRKFRLEYREVAFPELWSDCVPAVQVSSSQQLVAVHQAGPAKSISHYRADYVLRRNSYSDAVEGC